jgi:protein-disulfide isomerase
MSNQVKGGIAVVGLVAAAAAVGFLFTRDLGAFAGKAKGGVVPAGATASGAIGTYYGTPFTKEGLTSSEKAKVFEAEQQVYSVYEDLLARRYINEFLVRYQKEHNLKSVDEAREHYTASKVSIPADRIQAIIQQYKDDPRLKSLSPEQQVKEVRGALEGQAKQQVIGELVQAGRAKGEFEISMAKPVEPKLDVTDGGNYFMGPKDAKVTIVEFADYQCPYCARIVPTLMDVLKKYDGKVRWVYRDFPLDFHQQAKPAAIAANCAGEQGKYFEAHHYLFENYSSLGEELYGKLVTTLKLDKAKYEACRKNPATEKEVMDDMQAGVEYGVNGTPSYFINGRKVQAGSVSDFSRVIDEELSASR